MLHDEGGAMPPVVIASLFAASALAAPALADEIRTPVVAVQEQAEIEAVQPTLDELRWVARPVVVFADSANDPRFLQQMRMLEEREEELEERLVVVLTDTQPAERGPLRQELRPRDFNLVLIDTDGTVVQRRPAPTSAREILNLIDRLPSRRQETGSRRP
jgi:type II secretory pathway predicted ATPase ExeA